MEHLMSLMNRNGAGGRFDLELGRVRRARHPERVGDFDRVRGGGQCGGGRDQSQDDETYLGTQVFSGAPRAGCRGRS